LASGDLGVSAMVAKLRAIQAQFPDRVAAALSAEVEIEVTECKHRCPVYVGPPGKGKPLPGVLRGSIHQEGPFREGRRVWTTIVAGGPAGAYAIPQHEHLDWLHAVGQAKYIEGPLLEARPFLAARFAARLDLGSAPGVAA
jgi:hypothetical protein